MLDLLVLIVELLLPPAVAEPLASDSCRLFPLQLDRIWIKIGVGAGAADEWDDPEEEPLGHKVERQAAALEQNGLLGGHRR